MKEEVDRLPWTVNRKTKELRYKYLVPIRKFLISGYGNNKFSIRKPDFFSFGKEIKKL